MSLCYKNFVGFYLNSKCQIWEKYFKLMMNLDILFYSDVGFTWCDHGKRVFCSLKNLNLRNFLELDQSIRQMMILLCKLQGILVMHIHDQSSLHLWGPIRYFLKNYSTINNWLLTYRWSKPSDHQNRLDMNQCLLFQWIQRILVYLKCQHKHDHIETLSRFL